MKLSFSLAAALLAAPATALAAPAGAIDPTFGETQSGIAIVPFELGDENNDIATGAASDANGRIYLAGYADIDPANLCLAVTRLTADGVIDNTYGDGGDGRLCHQDPAFGWLVAQDIALQANGKLVAAGTAYDAGGSNPRFLACRFDTDGSPDPSFGPPASPGCRAIDFGADYADSEAHAIAIQTDGRIVLAGTTFDKIAGVRRAVLTRLDPGGQMDDAFGDGGFNIPLPQLTIDTGFLDVAQGPDGALVAVGSMTLGAVDQDFFLARLHQQDGSRDNGFNGAGIAQVAFDLGGAKVDIANAVRILSDNSILVAGSVQTDVPGQFRTAAAKLLVSGNADTTFGTDGQRAYDPCELLLDGCEMHTSDMQVMPSGNIVLAGTIRLTPNDPASADFFALRVDETGVPDPTFGVDTVGQEGMAFVDLAGDADTNARVLAQGERVLLAGTATFASNADFAIVRLGDGTLFSDDFEGDF